MLRSLFKQSSIYFVALVGGKALTTLTWIIFARIFTPEMTGSIIFFVTLIEVTTFISDFGLNQWYLKHADDTDEKKVYQQIISTRILTLIISMICLCFFLFITKTFVSTITIICIFALLPEAFLSIGDSYYLRKKQSYRIALKGILSTILFLSGLFILKNNVSFLSIVSLYVVSRITIAAWYFPWTYIKGITVMSITQMLKILSSSSAYALLIVSSYLYARGDSLIIGYIAGASALSLYGLAYRYLEGLSLFSSALTQNLFPISAKKAGISKSQVYIMTLAMGGAGIIVSLGVYIAADILIMILGPQYTTAVPVLRIFSIVLFLFFINAPIATVVQSSKYVKNFLPYGIANTVGNLLLNILIVPIYGIQGAAWVMALTEATGFFINLYFLKKVYNETK